MELNLSINIIGVLRQMKETKIKPNFSELGRLFKLDRHTVKKYYENDGIVIKQRERKSFYEQFKEEIIDELNKPGRTKKAVYMYIKNKYPSNKHNYNTYRSYLLSKGIKKQTNVIPHPRYETAPGEQLQVDWKENIKMTSKHGEVFEFNIYSATLGYSRLHTFIYSKNKTTEDFIRCTIDTLNSIGGSVRNITTDNMTAVVSITNGTRKKHPKIMQLEHDLGIRIHLCKVRSPETKGKVESSNRFIQWLEPYNEKFEDETELINIIRQIQIDCNTQSNQTTCIPPIKLFEKEKEYLLPLPSKVLIDTYVETVTTTLVPNTMLVNYKGKGYSVPKEYIQKRVKLIEIGNILHIYYNTKLIITHEMSSQKINYKKEHYISSLNYHIKSEEIDIERLAEENLKRLSKIGVSNK